ncbi:MAG: type II toxin-antitoxin system VapC family toxin [Deltaproteobacteria bacterium]|nr:type II toxin-antitoxin system VapC family toxin [Deltaproteobacteria bacterium]
MATLLLDTHAFLWWLAGDTRLSRRARAAVADEDNEVLVSAASAWEIATKWRLGKLPGVEAIVNDIAGAIAAQAFDTLPVTIVHAQRAGMMAGAHRDPFDRMLIAQALAEGLILVSNEALFDEFGVTRRW